MARWFAYCIVMFAYCGKMFAYRGEMVCVLWRDGLRTVSRWFAYCVERGCTPSSCKPLVPMIIYYNLKFLRLWPHAQHAQYGDVIRVMAGT